MSADQTSPGMRWAYSAGVGGVLGAATAALYAVLLVLSLIVLEAGDPVPPGGEDNDIPLTPGSFLMYAAVVVYIAGIAGAVGLALGAVFALALAPLVRVMRTRPQALALTVFVVAVSGGSLLLRNVNLGSTLTQVEQVLLHAVLPSGMAGGAAAWHVLRVAGAPRPDLGRQLQLAAQR